MPCSIKNVYVPEIDTISILKSISFEVQINRAECEYYV